MAAQDPQDPFEQRWHERPRVRRAAALAALCLVAGLAGHLTASLVFSPEAPSYLFRSPTVVERNSSGGCPRGYRLKQTMSGGYTCCAEGASCD